MKVTVLELFLAASGDTPSHWRPVLSQFWQVGQVSSQRTLRTLGIICVEGLVFSSFCQLFSRTEIDGGVRTQEGEGGGFSLGLG